MLRSKAIKWKMQWISQSNDIKQIPNDWTSCNKLVGTRHKHPLSCSCAQVIANFCWFPMPNEEALNMCAWKSVKQNREYSHSHSHSHCHMNVLLSRLRFSRSRIRSRRNLQQLAENILLMCIFCVDSSMLWKNSWRVRNTHKGTRK